MAASAYGCAIQGGGGAGEFEFARRGPVVEESVEKTGMKDVASAGGVRDVHVESGRIEKLGAVEGENAIVAERGGREFVRELFVDDLESLWQIGFAGDAAGNIVAGDKVIDFGQQCVDSRVELIEVDDDGDFCCAGPLRGLERSGGIVTVDKQRASGCDPFAVKVGGPECESIVMAAEDGAFPGRINDDEGLIAGAAGCGEEMCFDTGAFECGAVDLRGVVVAEFADVTRAKAPSATGDHGAGDFSARED